MDARDSDATVSDRLDDAFAALDAPGVIIACLPIDANSVRIVSAIDDIGPGHAEACALDLLRTVHTRMIADPCSACPQCTARIARLAVAIQALTQGKFATRPGGQH